MKRIFLSIFVCLLLLSGCGSNDVEMSDFYQYHYERLNEIEKEAYLQMYTAILHQEESVQLKGIKKDKLEDLFIKVRNDHPELFWLDNKYSYSTAFGDKLIEMNFSYLMDQEEAELITSKIEKIKDEFISTIKEGASDIKKAKAVYDFVIKRTKYVSASENDQNIQSVFITNESVCAGYARAIQYLLLNLGIDCAYIEGYGTNNDGVEMRHAWNMVHINDKWYYMDATWGDQVGDIEHACDAYFLMNSKEMLRIYEPSSSYEETKEDNHKYYKDKEMYFTSWNVTQIQKLWRVANAKDVRYIEMKCSENVYEDMVERIAKKGEMYEIMRQMGMFVDSIWYIKNDDLHTIEIFY